MLKKFDDQTHYGLIFYLIFKDVFLEILHHLRMLLINLNQVISFLLNVFFEKKDISLYTHM